MHIGVSMWSYVAAWKAGKLDVPGFVKEAKRAGADAVELLDYFCNQGDDQREAIEEALEEHNIPCAIFSVGNNLVQPELADREKAVDVIRHGVDEAVRYGAKVVRVFAGDTAEGIDYQEARRWIIEGLADACVYAAEHDTFLALENHGKLAGRGDQIKDIIEAVRRNSGTDALGANPDTGNFLLVGQPSHEALKEIAEYASMVHFKDFRHAKPTEKGGYTALDGTRFVGTAVGEGEVDLAACIHILRDHGFYGYLSVEYEGEEDPFTAVPRSIENARKLL